MIFLENFPLGEGWGRGRVWGKKKFCFVFSGPSGNCLPILKSISPKKRTDRQTDTQTDRHSIALRDRMNRVPNVEGIDPMLCFI